MTLTSLANWKWLPELLLLMAALLTLAALWRTVTTVTVAVSQPIPLPASPDARPTAPSPAPLHTTLFREPGAWSPFSEDEMSPDDARLADAPLSALPLRVTGIVSQRDGEKGQAILAAGQQQYSVTAGSVLPDSGARIVRILKDRIIITYQGQYQALLLEQDRPRQ